MTETTTSFSNTTYTQTYINTEKTNPNFWQKFRGFTALVSEFFQERIKNFAPGAAAPLIVTTTTLRTEIQAFAAHPSQPTMVQARPQNATLLAEMIAWGDLRGVQSAITAGADINGVNARGNTLLYEAIVAGKPEIVQFLVGKGADVRAVNTAGETVLHAAAKQGDLASFTLCLEKGANINALNRAEETVLHAAAKQGSPATLALCLENGVNALQRNAKGQTALGILDARMADLDKLSLKNPKSVAWLEGLKQSCQEAISLVESHTIHPMHRPKAADTLGSRATAKSMAMPAAA